MSTIINNYPVFESSQVLTSGQLNQLVSYLDQQNRLTRVKLIGMGIVCGLDLKYDDSGSNTTVTISKGTAITSEGFLITLGECETSYYRPYTLPEGVEYKPFGNPDQDVTLYELLREMPDDSTDVEELDTDPNFLDDKFVLLFLECFDNDLKSCLGNTCDELGMERIFTIRKLLISQDDLDKVLTRSGNVGGLYPYKYGLPEIAMPRPLFDPAEPHSQDYTAFSENYVNAFSGSAYPALFGDLSNSGALAETYSVYEPLLGEYYDFNNPFDSAIVTDLKNTWKGFWEATSSPGPDYRGVQYFYGFLKDLILAYNEFRQCAFDMMSECCPDMSLFPKHIMLGKAISVAETADEKATYRHGFAQPPIYNHQKHLIEKTISLHKRLVMMVEKFDLDIINNPEEDQEVKITPSCEKKTQLGVRSIPYYYKSREETTLAGSGNLEQYWSYEKSRSLSSPTDPFLLSYENQSDDLTTQGSLVETPLYYDLDEYSFFRIEGLIGKEFESVRDRVNQLKKDFNLPFETVALQLDPSTESIEVDYSCGFEDLQEDYTMHRYTFCSFIEDLLDVYNYIFENRDTLFENDDIDPEILKRVEEFVDLVRQLCDVLAECIKDFDFEAFQDAYKEVICYITDFLLVDMELHKQITINEKDVEKLQVYNDILQLASPFVFKILDLFFYTKFYKIHYGIKRREFYLKRETATLSGYLTKNPGLAHQAGVYKGGTFVIIHEGGDSNAVIADFNLPYLCCSKEVCVPACDNDFFFNAKPFARPDFAVTVADVPVNIDVEVNDFGIINSTFEVELVDDPSGEYETAGSVSKISDEAGFEYTPPSGFQGVDFFWYRLTNAENGESDIGKVTVIVAETRPDCVVQVVSGQVTNPNGAALQGVSVRVVGQESIEVFTDGNGNYSIDMQSVGQTLVYRLGGFTSVERSICNNEQEDVVLEPIIQPNTCYTRDILLCWGVRNVRTIADEKGLNPSGKPDDQVVDELLNSLQATGGFSVIDIQNPTLETLPIRRSLVTCLGLIDDSTVVAYEELAHMIMEYQNENCGSTEQYCIVTDVTGIVRNANNTGIGGVSISIKGGAQIGTTNRQGNYTLSVGTSGQTIVFSADGFRSEERFICRSSTVNVTMEADFIVPSVEIDLTNIPDNELSSILGRRGIAVSTSGDRGSMIVAVNSSAEANKFSEPELNLLSNNTLRALLRSRGIQFTLRERKDSLINKLITG